MTCTHSLSRTGALCVPYRACASLDGEQCQCAATTARALRAVSNHSAFDVTYERVTQAQSGRLVVDGNAAAQRLLRRRQPVRIHHTHRLRDSIAPVSLFGRPPRLDSACNQLTRWLHAASLHPRAVGPADDQGSWLLACRSARDARSVPGT